jgi:hypothetical protein
MRVSDEGRQAISEQFSTDLGKIAIANSDMAETLRALIGEHLQAFELGRSAVASQIADDLVRLRETNSTLEDSLRGPRQRTFAGIRDRS